MQEKGVPVDIVCCLQHLQVLLVSFVSSIFVISVYDILNERSIPTQLCFETEDRARSLLRNVSSLLKPGGYFFGITTDSSTIWYVLSI